MGKSKRGISKHFSPFRFLLVAVGQTATNRKVKWHKTCFITLISLKEPKMKQLKILKDALALIRQGHAKGTLARTQDGETAYVLGEDAVCFCAVGAICKVDGANDPWRGYHSSVGALIQVNKDKSIKPKRISESAQEALVAVAHQLQTSFHRIWEINDGPGGRDKIVAAYEGAIAKLEKENG